MDWLSTYLWQIYEDFQPGPHGFPYPGDLVHYYRLYWRKTKAEIAAALTCSIGQLDDMELHRLPVEEVTSREVLVTVLAIPPLLLGLPPYNAPRGRTEELAPQEFNELLIASGAPVIDLLIVKIYADIHQFLARPSSFSAIPSSYERTLSYWIGQLQERISHTSGVARDQYRSLWYEFLHLQGWHAFKQDDLSRAYDFISGALEQGHFLTNTKLIISALVQRIPILLQQQQEEAAIQDLETLLWYVELFYQTVDRSISDTTPAVHLDLSYTKIADAILNGRLQEQLHSLHDRTIALILDARKTDPNEVFTLLNDKARKARRDHTK